MSQPLSIKPGDKVHLKDFDPRFCGDDDKKSAEAELAKLGNQLE